MFWLAFVCLGDPGDLAVQPVYMNFTSHTTSFPLPSPSTHNSLTSLYLCIQGGHLHTICQLSDLFLSLLVLEKVMEASSHCISGNITQKFKPTEALALHLYIHSGH